MSALLTQLLRQLPASIAPQTSLSFLLKKHLKDFLTLLLHSSVQVAIDKLLLLPPPILNETTDLQELTVVYSIYARLLSKSYTTELNMELAGALEDEYALVLISLCSNSGSRRGVLSLSSLLDLTGRLSDSNTELCSI